MPFTEVKHDHILLNLIVESDEKAFNELFGRYRDRLYNYFVKVSKSKEASEEMVLDVFMKIWNNKPILTEINNFEAFLFRVAHNKAIDFLRHLQRSKKAQEVIWAEMAELAIAASSDERIIKEDTEKIIQQAISQLSPQRQEVFRLSREEYLSYDEIAEKMQLSKFTVRNHLSAALQFLREHLTNGSELAIIITLISKQY